LGGVAGYAGVFSTLEDMGKLCTMILRDGASDTGKFLSHERIQEFSTDFTPTLGVGRGVGFLLGGSKGSPAETNTYGHTGFTGTSIWMHPKHKLAAILLTNRVHPSRDNQLLLPLRRTFHDLAFCLGANPHEEKVIE
jgi:CubicO group peptidase (beta-lactamase class C family)